MSLALTRDQVRRLDALAIEALGIPGVVLMENAGRGAAEIILGILQAGRLRRTLVVCGPGNNGGDGSVIARHLFNAGREVSVVLAAPEGAIRGDALVNYRVIRNMGIDILSASDRNGIPLPAVHVDDLVVDALLGTGFQGPLREPYAGLIAAINAADASFTVSIDVPSGLDCDTGQPDSEAVRADQTITFVAPKVGFSRPESIEWTGEVRVVGIGTPPSLVDRVIGEGR